MTAMLGMKRGQGMGKTQNLRMATRTGERKDRAVNEGLSGYCSYPWNSLVQVISQVRKGLESFCHQDDLPSSQTPVMIDLALTCLGWMVECG